MLPSRHRRDWNDLAVVDPLWAVSAAPDKRYGRWSLGDFFETGQDEIDAVMREAFALGRPRRRTAALDFGCGVGRGTRVLARYFERCEGVDISEEMVKLARELNADIGNCSFTASSEAHLGRFPSESFDFVYSSFVLQHLPSVDAARAYIREFLRLVRPDGLVVFQMPDCLPWRARIQLRRRAYAALRLLGLPRERLYATLHLHPVRLIALSKTEIEDLVRGCGGSLLRCDLVDARQAVAGFRYYVARSDQYARAHAGAATAARPQQTQVLDRTG